MSKISVVLTTYNGENYIERQLKSILEQSIKADEIIICDDCSTDKTLEIVGNFIHRNNIVNWYVSKNKENLGWKKNFFEASKKATGDIIFFSDQDDIWNPNKIEKMVNVMLEKNAGCVFGDCEIIDENDILNKKRNEVKKFTNEVRLVNYSVKFNFFVTLGCRMCVSRDVLNKYLLIDDPDSGHDSQCGRIALLTSSMYHLNSSVIQYRIHSKNSSGISSNGSFGKSSLDKRINNIENNIIWLNKILEMDFYDIERKEDIIKLIELQELRRKYLLKTKGVSYFKLKKKKKLYLNKSMLVGDFAYRHGLNNLFGKIRWKIKKMVNK